MDLIFLGIVVFLCVLAVFDLVVGVSNDAVNFLNSAIADYQPIYTDGNEEGISGEEAMRQTPHSLKDVKLSELFNK